jgi:putative membrane protein
MWHDGGWGGWLAMASIMVVFWGGIITLAIWLLRGGAFHQVKDRSEGRSTALDVLDERFARGEIDREEYESRRSVLIGSDAGQH